jgi:hypothetical protein
MQVVKGGCHCGSIIAELRFSQPTHLYRPRACDCDFCRLHGAAYVSDPRGTLSIRLEEPRHRGVYRQGSELAQFLLCRNCGVLIGVLYAAADRLYGAVNARIAAADVAFGEPLAVAPRRLGAAEKRQRWEEVWFPDVLVVEAGPQ